MSFIRCMSSGVMFCIAPLIWSTVCCMSCWRSVSISSSNRWRASPDSKSYALQFAHLAGQVVGHHVEPEVAILGGLAGWSRRGVRRRWPGVAGVLDRVTLFVDDVVERLGDLAVDAAEVAVVEPFLALAAQSVDGSRGSPCSCSPLRSLKPSCIIRRSALFTSPW